MVLACISKWLNNNYVGVTVVLVDANWQLLV